MSIAYYERLVQEDIDTGVDPTTKRNPGGGTLAATQVSLSTFAIGQAEATTSWDPGTVANQSYAAKSLTVTGARAGDKVLPSLTTLTTQNVTISAHVSANDTVTVVINNLSGSNAVITAGGTLSVLVFTHR